MTSSIMTLVPRIKHLHRLDRHSEASRGSRALGKTLHWVARERNQGGQEELPISGSSDAEEDATNTREIVEFHVET